jgi:beta-phosphoglucomutase-like phosphatase (HAD superfamily)
VTSTERAPEGVIFDLDGTVTDTLSIAFSVFRAAVAEFMPHQFTDEELMRFFRPTEEPHNWELCFERYLDEYKMPPASPIVGDAISDAQTATEIGARVPHRRRRARA